MSDPAARTLAELAQDMACRAVDPVARTRAQLRREITTLRHELAETWDSAACAEIAVELERAESQLASLDMCFA